MDRPCAAHPDARSSGDCSACGRPFCPACVREDVARERAYCSTGCRDLDATTPAAVSRDPVDLVAGLARPIRTGWRLWLAEAPRLTGAIALPLGFTVGVLRATLVEGALGEIAGGRAIYDVCLVVTIALGAAATAVTLSRAHTATPAGSPWGQVVARLLPWAFTWLVIGAAVLAGTLLLVVPGIIAGIRLFWADEFALMHRHGPRSAVRESIALSRGLTGRVFSFQIILGFAEYLVLVPLLLGVVGIEMLEDAIPPGPVATVVATTLISVLVVNTYASLHAPEVVYFYGLRALRATLPPDELHGDWVLRGLRADARAEHPELPACPSCGSSWNPADYRRDAEPIFCSHCKSELRRPA